MSAVRMRRRRFFALTLLQAMGTGCAVSGDPTGLEAPPDIVLILADDMGYGDPRCNNPQSKIATPQIDRIAHAGIRFTDAHAPASWCTPTRYGLLTGRYPFRHRRAWNQRCIDAGRGTLASMLRTRGYTTAMVGKWHLWFDGKHGIDRDWSQPLRGGPMDCGFDSFFGIPASLDIQPYYYIRDDRPVAPPIGRVASSDSSDSVDGWTKIQGAFWRQGGRAEGFRHDRVLPDLTTAAVDFIDSQGRRRRRQGHERRPFFLYFALPAPHTPWLPSPRFRGQSAASMYGDFVMQVDDTVGQILAALDRHGMTRDTLVLFTSDNGPVWYPKDVQRHRHRSVGPLRGMKADAYEGGHRMPFLVRWPGRVAANTVSGHLLCFTDIMATFAEIVGAKLPAGAGDDSVSFLRVLRGQPAPPRGPIILKANATVIRDGKWKMISHLGSGGFTKPRRVKPKSTGPRGQLYDLAVDLGETNNLWEQRPEVVQRLTATLRQMKARLSR